ncbi:MAG TPA: ABC transporter ATP-binding protein [Terriglobales bacterium]|nr:ABC transporter ATP-binding protein [Terriglobales bacterium]
MTQALDNPVTPIPSHAADHVSTPAREIGLAESALLVRKPRAVKLSLNNVCFSYATNSKGRLVALKNIQLHVRAGEFLCIVGPSGCGKSTLLHLIAGSHRQTSGEVLVDKVPVIGPGTDRILIFQELGLFPWLTVSQNVEFGMKMKGIPKAERKSKVHDHLRMVQLHQFKESYPHQLSGGMRQRVALARALATEPDVLLMDEPFAALDAQTRDLLHDELERIWSETQSTIVFVTHNVREAVRLGDRVALLTFRPGQVKREYNIDLSRPRHLEDVRVAASARDILNDLREEINKSFEEEYGHEARA